MTGKQATMTSVANMFTPELILQLSAPMCSQVTVLLHFRNSFPNQLRVFDMHIFHCVVRSSETLSEFDRGASTTPPPYARLVIHNDCLVAWCMGTPRKLECMGGGAHNWGGGGSLQTNRTVQAVTCTSVFVVHVSRKDHTLV